jgi:hypothetical protein
MEHAQPGEPGADDHRIEVRHISLSLGLITSAELEAALPRGTIVIAA